MASVNLTKTLGGVTLTPPGGPEVNTIHQFTPKNAVNRPNPLGSSADLGNGVGKYPLNMDIGLQDSFTNLQIMADSFLPQLGIAGTFGYRKYFEKQTIPRHMNTTAKQYMRIGHMDTSPATAALKNLATSWNPTMNEVTLTATAMTITTNAYGRYYKTNSFAEAILSINWGLQISKSFASNAADTMDNLAAWRMYEGANKIFVTSIAAFDPADPFKARIILGADASTVATTLNLDVLLEAKYQMQNAYETYTTIDPTTHVLKHDNKRKRPIPGYQGGSYRVLMGHNGYNQLMSDERFRSQFVVNGGHLAPGLVAESIGMSSPIFGMIFEKIDNVLTISKAAKPVLSSNGELALEVAYVIGGGVSPVGIELTFEGFTKMISVPYNDSRKIDPFELLSIYGWMTVTDFNIVQNEALYAIPYTNSSSLIISGEVISPTNRFKA